MSSQEWGGMTAIAHIYLDCVWQRTTPEALLAHAKSVAFERFGEGVLVVEDFHIDEELSDSDSFEFITDNATIGLPNWGVGFFVFSK